MSAAEPSGLWAALKEAIASRSALAAAKTDADTNELIESVVADSIQDALRKNFSGAKPADVVQRSLSTPDEVSRLLDAKAPQDTALFKAWPRGISQNVAEAAKEGGFLGFGGVQVSDAEKATLAGINKTLA